MERELFDWCAWDEVGGPGFLEFHGCALRVPIGNAEAGDLIPVILIDFDHGSLQLCGKERQLISEHKVCLALC